MDSWVPSRGVSVSDSTLPGPGDCVVTEVGPQGPHTGPTTQGGPRTTSWPAVLESCGTRMGYVTSHPRLPVSGRPGPRSPTPTTEGRTRSSCARVYGIRTSETLCPVYPDVTSTGLNPTPTRHGKVPRSHVSYRVWGSTVHETGGVLARGSRPP